jgi:hypothetical protein
VSLRANAALALCGLLAGCLQAQADPAYLPVSLQAPYSDLPEAPNGTALEPGMPVPLDPQQQEAVVAGVRKWMKEPGSAWFGPMTAVKLRQGKLAICGQVDGSNSAGSHSGMARFVGVMMGPSKKPEFVVVSIARNGHARAEIDTICQRIGIF